MSEVVSIKVLVDDEQVAKLQEKTSGIVDNIDNINLGIRPQNVGGETLFNSSDYFKETLTDAMSVLSQFEAKAKTMSTYMRSLFDAPLQAMQQQMQAFGKFVGEIGKGRVVSADKMNLGSMRAAEISNLTANLSKMLDVSSNPILNQHSITQSNQIIRNIVDNIIRDERSHNRGVVNSSYLAGMVANDKTFRNYIQQQTGFQYNDKEYEDAARAFVLSSRLAQRMSSDRRAAANAAPIIRTPIPVDNAQALPHQSMAEVYLSEGIRQGKVSRGKEIADQAVYRRLQKLTRGGKNNALIQAAQRANLANLENGEIGWKSNATLDQVDTVAGYLLRDLEQTRRGSPLHPRDAMTNTSASSRIQDIQNALNVLAQESRLEAGIMEITDKNDAGGKFKKMRGPARVQTIRTPSSYIIPQTSFDKEGKLIYRDPSEAARGKEPHRAYGEIRPDDKFIEFQESTFARLLGYTRDQHNTYGYGYDENRLAKYGPPRVIKVTADGLVETDEYDMPKPATGTATETMKHVANAINKKTQYGGRTYRYGWNAAQGKGFYFIDDEAASKVEAEAKALGLASPFQAFNTNGVVQDNDIETTYKQINNLRKGATPTVNMSELGYGKKELKIGTIDYSILDDYYSSLPGNGQLTKADQIDGLAFLSLSAAPESIQGRLFAGAGKFMGQRMSLPNLIKKSNAITKDLIEGSNQLVRKNDSNKYGFSVFAPSVAMGNLDEKERNKIMSGMINGTFSQQQADEYLKLYFTDLMEDYDVLLTDSTIKNVDKFRVMSVANYQRMFGDRARYGAIEEAMKRNGDSEKAMIQLNAREAEEYMTKAAKFTGNLSATRTSDDFQTESDTIDITAAMAMNLPPSMFRRQNELYEQKKAKFNDPVWLRQYLQNMSPIYKQKIDANSDWISQDEAQGIIEEQLKGIERDQHTEHRVMVDRAGKNVLATMFPGIALERYFDLIGAKVDPNQKVAPLFPQFIGRFMEQQGYTNIPYVKGMEDSKVVDMTKIMYSPAFKDWQLVSGRQPQSPGTFSDMINLAYLTQGEKNRAFFDAFAAVGMNDQQIATLTTQGMNRMNTGDFDGDTVWLYALMSDEMGNSLKTFNERYNRAVEKRKNPGGTVIKPGKRIAQDVTNFGKEALPGDLGQLQVGASINAARSQLAMGAGAAGIRNLMTYGDLTKDENMEALLDLVDYYDKGTSEMLNKGEQHQITNMVAKQYLMAGRTYNRLMKQIGQEEAQDFQDRHIDNLFKYNGPSIHSRMDLANVDFYASTRHNTLQDQGLRDRLLGAADRRYAGKGAALEEAADWFANFIADTETGYKYYSVDEYSTEVARLAQAIRAESEDKEHVEHARALTSQIERFSKEGLSLDALRRMAKSDNATDARIAQDLLSKQSQKQERAAFASYYEKMQDRRKIAREIMERQRQAEKMQQIDAAQLGIIQDTSRPDQFHTSWSVTSVEPWMGLGGGRDALLNMTRGNVTTINLREDPFNQHRRQYEVTDRSLGFGDANRIAEKEAQELQKKDYNNADTVLGTFMHAGFEKFFADHAKDIASGTFRFDPDSFGSLTDIYRGLLSGTITDYSKNKVSIENLFRSVGIETKDILQGLDTGTFGDTVLFKGEKFVQKMNNIFGVGNQIYDEVYKGKQIGATHALLYSLLGLDPEEMKEKPESTGDEAPVVVTKGNKTAQQTVAAATKQSKADSEARKSENLRRHALRDMSMKRLVMTEDTIFDEKGEAITLKNTDLYDLPNGRVAHAKPDLIYESRNGTFNILDYKSSSKGSLEAMYQNMMYIKMLEELGLAAHTGVNAKGEQIDQAAFAPYRQFINYDQTTGQWKSKFEGGKIESFDLLQNSRNVMNYSQENVDKVRDEYFEAIKRKQKALQEGYIDGKLLLQEQGVLEGVNVEAEKEKQKIGEISGSFTDKDSKRREFLLQQFASDKENMPELLQETRKMYSRYAKYNPHTPINKFAGLREKLSTTMSPEMLAALRSQYGDQPEILKFIDDVATGRVNALQQLDLTVNRAVQQDPKLAMERMQEMVLGTESQSALKTIQALRMTARTAEGSREELKSDARFFKDNTWQTEANLVKITDNMTKEQKDKAQTYNINEQKRANEATRRQILYEQAQYPISEMRSLESTLGVQALQNELKADDLSANILSNGEMSPREKLRATFEKQDLDIKTAIETRMRKINEIVEQLYGVDDSNNPLVTDQNLINQMQASVKAYKEQIQQLQGQQSKTKAQTAKNAMRQLGMYDTTEEDADNWFKERQAALAHRYAYDREYGEGKSARERRAQYLEELESYKQHRDSMKHFSNQERENAFTVLQHSLMNTQMTDEERRAFYGDQYESAIWKQMKDLVPGTDLYKRYQDKLNDTKAKDEYIKRNEDRYQQEQAAQQQQIERMGLMMTPTAGQNVDWQMTMRNAQLQKMLTELPNDSPLVEQIQKQLSPDQQSAYRDFLMQQEKKQLWKQSPEEMAQEWYRQREGFVVDKEAVQRINDDLQTRINDRQSQFRERTQQRKDSIASFEQREDELVNETLDRDFRAAKKELRRTGRDEMRKARYSESIAGQYYNDARDSSNHEKWQRARAKQYVDDIRPIKQAGEAEIKRLEDEFRARKEDEYNRALRSGITETMTQFGLSERSEKLREMMENGKVQIKTKKGKTVELGGWKQLEEEKIAAQQEQRRLMSAQIKEIRDPFYRDVREHAVETEAKIQNKRDVRETREAADAAFDAAKNNIREKHRELSEGLTEERRKENAEERKWQYRKSMQEEQAKDEAETQRGIQKDQQKAEEQKKRASRNMRDLIMERDQIEGMLSRDQRNPADALRRQIAGQSLTFQEQLGLNMQNMKDRIIGERMKYQVNTPMWKMWNDMYKDEDAWNQYETRMNQQHENQYINEQERLLAANLSANMQASMPTNARHYTMLGRSIGARMQRNMQMQNAYLGATQKVNEIQTKLDEAKMSGDQEAVNKLQTQLQTAQAQQQNVRNSGGLSGLISAHLLDKYDTQARQHAENQEKLISADKDLAKAQDDLKTLTGAAMPGNKDDEKAIDEAQRNVDRLKGLKESREQALKESSRGMQNAGKDLETFNKTGSIAAGTFDTFTQSIMRFGSQFGRRIFMNAIREATQFVKQYDQSMRQIQAITMKTDEEMVGIRSETIDQAVKMRTSTKNMASLKTDLYRQGLSDSEVNNRAEAITKFATVTGTKVTAASKIITSALQNGLVSSAQQAMDVLTALGDTAATTAEEIGKGMQKQAASAKVAGVSYEELATMLTIITSNTQLGGNQAGTALNTIFSRMRKVTANKLATDESGESTSISDVESQLALAGVNLRESGNKNKMRSGTEILLDLAKRWEDLNDLQRQAINNAIAGTKQSNMFYSLMEGLSANGGKDFEEMLGLAENSEGTTESKYEIMIKGINGAVEELKANWDAFIYDGFMNNGIVQTVLTFTSNAVAGFANMASSISGIGAALVALIPIISAVIAKFAILNVLKSAAMGIGGKIGAIAGIVGLVGLSGFLTWGIQNNVGASKMKELRTPDEQAALVQEETNWGNKKIKVAEKAMEDLTKVYEKGKEIGNWQDYADEATQSFDALVAMFPNLKDGITSAGDAFATWNTWTQKALDNVKELRIETAKNSAMAAYGNVNSRYDELKEKTSGLRAQNLSFNDFMETNENNIPVWLTKLGEVTSRNGLNEFDAHTLLPILGAYRLNWANAIKSAQFEALEADEYGMLDEIFNMFKMTDIGSAWIAKQQENYKDKDLRSYKDFMSTKNHTMILEYYDMLWKNPELSKQMGALQYGYDPKDLYKEYLNDIFQSDQYYGPAVDMLLGKDDTMLKALINKYIEDQGDLSFENLDPHAIFKWMFNEETGALIKEEGEQIKQQYAEASDFKYGWYDIHDGVLDFGFDDPQYEGFKKALQARREYLQGLQDGTDYSGTIDYIDELLRMQEQEYRAATYTNVKNNMTGNTYGTSLKDTVKQIRSQTTQKQRGYENEYKKMRNMSHQTNNIVGLQTLIGGTQDFENLTGLLSDTTLNDMLYDLLYNTASPTYTYQDLVNYLDEKTNLAGHKKTIERIRRMNTISIADEDIASLKRGDATKEVIDRVANALNVDSELVRHNMAQYAQIYDTQNNILKREHIVDLTKEMEDKTNSDIWTMNQYGQYELQESWKKAREAEGYQFKPMDYVTTNEGTDLERTERKYRIDYRDARLKTIKDLEETGDILSGTAEMFSNLTSGNLSVKHQGESGIIRMYNSIGTLSHYRDMLDNNTNNRTWWIQSGHKMIDDLGQTLNWSDEMIKRFKDPKNKADLKKAIDDSVKELNDTLVKQIASMLGKDDLSSFESMSQIISALQNSSDAAANSLASLLSILQEMGVIFKNGEFSGSNTTATANQFMTYADETSGYSQGINDNKYKNEFYRRLSSGKYTYVEDVIDSMQQQYQWTDKEAEEFLSRQSGFSNALAKAEPDTTRFTTKTKTSSDGIPEQVREKERVTKITDNMVNDFRSSQNYGSFYGGVDFENNMDAYLDVAANGFNADELAKAFENNSDLEQWLQQFEAWADIQKDLSSGKYVDANQRSMQRLNAEMSAKHAGELKLYGNSLNTVQEYVRDLGKGGAAAQKVHVNLQKIGKDLQNIKYVAQQIKGKSGKGLDSNERSALAGATGLDENTIKNMTKEEIQQLAKFAETQSDEQFGEIWGGTIIQQIETAANNYIAAHGQLDIDLGEIDINQDGQYDLKEIGALGDALGDEILQELAAKAGPIGQLVVELTKSDKGLLAQLVLSSLKGKKGGGGGGGGGGGKSDMQKLIEKFKHEQALADHRLKMLQFQEKKYENAGELANLNYLLENEENPLREELIEEYEGFVEELKEKMKTLQKDSDDWIAARDAIMQYEEAIEDCNIAIEENKRKIEENWSAIRKTRTALEDTLDQEIKNRIQRERDMLDGTVQMQNTMLDAIKNRYQEEWDLEKRSIEKKKEALEEEKSLIDERLNKRKEAADEAEKYEELAELKRQLAMISMDSTRTRDAAELRKKIADIEKDIAWDLMEDEAEAQKESIDDESKALDDYTSIGDEQLEAMLNDANTFTEEVTKVLQSSQADLFQWLRDNVKEYANSLEEAQQQMVNSWTDMYKQMHGITDTYWDDIDAIIMGGKDEYIEYMMGSEEFKNASETNKEEMLYQWGQNYDAFLAAYLETHPEYKHFEDFTDYGTEKPAGGGSGGKKKKGFKAKFGQSEKDFETEDEAKAWIKQLQDYWKQQTDMNIRHVLNAQYGYVDYDLYSKMWAQELAKMPVGSVEAFKQGGLVDFTGPAWVDGTKMKPEAFLDAEDTALIRNWLDQAKYVRLSPFSSNITNDMFGSSGFNIGDVTVQITEASFKEDADYEEVARRVGQAFVKELGKQGLNMANYAF